MTPIPFAHSEIVHAADDSSPSGLSAYIGGCTRTNSVTGSHYNFSHKASHVVHHEVMLPDAAPERFRDAEVMWNEATARETTLDRKTRRLRFKRGAQVAKHVILALPKELNDAGRLALTQRFIRENYTRFGLAVEFAIHRPELGSDNHHAHLLVTTRRITGSGFGQKARDLNPHFATNGAGKRFVSEADRISDVWAELQNNFFTEHGFDLRVDPKRNAPAVHAGPAWHAPDSEKLQKKADRDEAAALAMQDPAKVLERITVNKATFTRRDLQKFVSANGLRGKDRDAAVEAALLHEAIVRLDDSLGREIYTTKAVRAQERELLRSAYRIKLSGPSLTSAAILAATIRNTLDAEQAAALKHLMTSTGLRVLIGRAGTGKTRTLAATREVLLASGYSVRALAPTNTAALNLRAEGFEIANTLHRELYLLRKGKIRWDKKTALVVDEAGMLDSEILGELLSAAADAGATVIMAGDDRQLTSVRRGGMFAELTKRFNAIELRRVRRQQQDWQREASQDFSRGHIAAGIRAYSERGHVHWQVSLDESRAQLLADWASNPDATNQFIYASTNVEVNRINSLARAIRVRRGEIADGAVLSTDRGQVHVAAGDRLQFYANDRPAGIVNGIVGTVQSVDPHRVEVITDFGATVAFDPSEFTAWGLGYSGTVYRSQGKTQLKVFALFDNPYAWNVKTAYVAMTRHKSEVNLYTSKDIAADESTLARMMARTSEDAAAISYPIFKPAEEPAAPSADLAALRVMMAKVDMSDANERHEPPLPTRPKRKRRTRSPSSAATPRRSPR